MSGDKNCSKLVWSAYKNAGNLDIDSNKETWIAYFAPSSTDVMYTEGNASLVEFNKNGTAKFNGYTYKEDNTLNENTVGYTMAGTLKDSLYYFLCNGSFKKDYYSSKIILGDKKNNTVHEIKGFVNSYGNDEDNIYLLTDDMTNRNNKQVQKVSINNLDDITTTSNNIAFDYEVESNFKIIVSDTYIYAFVIRDRNKIYYPALLGKVYRFDIDTENFTCEFTLKNYSMNTSLNPICYYDDADSKIYLFYQEDIDNKYYLYSYNLDGKLLDSIKLNSLKLKNNLYPHNFIKVST